MMTEKELQEKRRKKTDRIVLVFFLVLIFIPIFLYLLAQDSPERVNRLYFAGYVAMAAAIYYSAQAIRRSLAQQNAPILESMLVKSQTAAVFPQEYLDLTEQIKRSMQSRRYFRRSLARRLTLLLERKGLPDSGDLPEGLGLPGSLEKTSADPRLTAILASLHEPEPAAEESHAEPRFRDSLVRILNRFADHWDSLTGQGMSAKELENIIMSLKEL